MFYCTKITNCLIGLHLMSSTVFTNWDWVGLAKDWNMSAFLSCLFDNLRLDLIFLSIHIHTVTNPLYLYLNCLFFFAFFICIYSFYFHLCQLITLRPFPFLVFANIGAHRSLDPHQNFIVELLKKISFIFLVFNKRYHFC